MPGPLVTTNIRTFALSTVIGKPRTVQPLRFALLLPNVAGVAFARFAVIVYLTP